MPGCALFVSAINPVKHRRPHYAACPLRGLLRFVALVSLTASFVTMARAVIIAAGVSHVGGNSDFAIEYVGNRRMRRRTHGHKAGKERQTSKHAT